MQPVQDLSIDTAVSATQYQFTLENQDLATLQQWTPKVLERLGKISEIVDVASDLQPNGRSVTVNIDRASAARFGITPASIDNALYDAYGQRIVSTIFTQSNQYRVILDIDPSMTHSLSSLNSIYLPTSASTTGQVPLNTVSKLEVKQSPLQISHLKQFPVTTISFNLAPGASLGGAVDAIGAALKDIDLPASFAISFQGAAQAFQSSLSNEVFLLLAAILAMYIVLGVLYESFIHPITILSTLPSAGIGALLALNWAGAGLDIIGVIGIVLLIGIVKKNAIMMIDFALEAQRVDGLNARDAIYQRVPLAASADPDDDGRGDVRRAAPDAGNGRRLRAAPSARPRHRRRPRGQPGADAVHDAGDLSLLRAYRRFASALAPPAASSRRRRREQPVFRALHPPARRHDAADDRHRLRRPARVPATAGGPAAAGRFRDGFRLGHHARREPGHDGDAPSPRRWSGISARSPTSTK